MYKCRWNVGARLFIYELDVFIYTRNQTISEISFFYCYYTYFYVFNEWSLATILCHSPCCHLLRETSTNCPIFINYAFHVSMYILFKYLMTCNYYESMWERWEASCASIIQRFSYIHHIFFTWIISFFAVRLKMIPSLSPMTKHSSLIVRFFDAYSYK